MHSIFCYAAATLYFFHDRFYSFNPLPSDLELDNIWQVIKQKLSLIDNCQSISIMLNKMWLSLFFHKTYWFAELISLSFPTSPWDISIELAVCICCNEPDAYFLCCLKIIYFAFWVNLKAIYQKILSVKVKSQRINKGGWHRFNTGIV